MIFGSHPSIWLAFLAGILSFLSPCCLPMYPSYLSYISGVTYDQRVRSTSNRRWKAFVHTFFFIIGFSNIFFALGLSASAVGQVFVGYRGFIRVFGGMVIVLMGIQLSGFFTFKFLLFEKRWRFHSKTTGYLRSILVGISFAAGWSPCIGPILSAVLMMTATNSSIGIPLIVMYISGFAVPFFVLGITMVSVRRLIRYGSILTKIAGSMMIVLGAMLITNTMTTLIEWLTRLDGGFSGF